jgi:plastocyanin
VLSSGVLSLRAFALVCVASVVLSADGTLVTVPGQTGVAGKPQANVVVWLDAAAAAPTVKHRIVLDQRNLQFAPRVLAVRTGTTVEFPNNDRVFHNVFSFRDGKRFDLGLYPIGSVKHVQFDRAGISRLFCNIHPQMAAYVIAVDSPYFAVSDESGSFTLADVPSGTYTYRAWRASGPSLTGTISIAPGIRLEIQWP